MKNLLLLALLLLTVNSFAQNEDSSKVRRNEIGLDITSLIGRTAILSVYGYYPTDYEPTYYAYYRRNFDKIRLRAAAGGDLSSIDLEQNNKKKLSLDYKIGAEFFSPISKRFELYYGLDLVGGKKENSYNYEYYDEYLYDVQLKTDYIGAAPFLGIRFQITDRMNMRVEMAMVVRQESIIDKFVLKEVLVDNPSRDLLEERDNDFKHMRVFYTAPDFIVLGFVL
jgi:hypothetical protein